MAENSLFLKLIMLYVSQVDIHLIESLTSFSRLPMTNSRPSDLKILLLFVVTIFFWSSSLVAIRIALKSYHPGSLALLRYLIASLGMVLVWGVAHKHRIPWRDIPVIFFMGVMGFGVYNVTLNYGELSVSAGVAGFIISQMPAVITLLAIIFLGERLTGRAWLGMGVSLIGLILIVMAGQQDWRFGAGIIFLLIAVMSGAIYHVTYKRLLARYHAMELTAYAIWGGTLSMLFYAPSVWRDVFIATPAATWSVVYLGIFPGIISYVSWSYALRYVPASKAASAFYVMPLITALMGWVCLGEVLPGLVLTGGLIALGGAMWVAKANKASRVKSGQSPGLVSAREKAA